METVQYISESGGGGGLLVLGAFFFVIGIVKIAVSGTLSENAQRRNYKRDKESK